MTTQTDVRPEAAVQAPPRRRRGLIIGAAVAAALVLLAVFLLRPDRAESPTALPSASPSPSATPLKPAEIFAAVAPSVVTIESLDAQQRVTGTGTGVVASGQGVILTALHVVNGAARIRITFADGTRSGATVRSADPANDIAALVPDGLPDVLVPAVLGSSGRLAVGDAVVAIGNQFGLTYSTTAGVVSGLDRGTRGKGGTNLNGLIQFDAAVNPGSSGGPLVNDRGETVGIVVPLANPTDAETFIGIGFAVPIGTAVGGGGRGPQQ
jgi:S1-C subfamily serine protease